MVGSSKQSSVNSEQTSKEVSASVPAKPETLLDKSIYIEGVRVLQRQERISYFFTLAISLVLVLLLFVILRVV